MNETRTAQLRQDLRSAGKHYRHVDERGFTVYRGTKPAYRAKQAKTVSVWQDIAFLLGIAVLAILILFV